MLIVLAPLLMSQNYEVTRYTVKDGLPIDLVKSVTQDYLGFIWVATDNGVVRFDGTDFENFSNYLPSQYVKALLPYESGLLITTDQGVLKTDNKVTYTEFQTLIKGDFLLTDSTVWYPKSTFVDDKGNYWISENGAIVRKDKNGDLKRFYLREDDYSLSFLRGHYFAEDNENNFFLITFSGSIFLLNTVTDRFDKIVETDGKSYISAVTKISDESYLLAKSTGVYLFNSSTYQIKKIPIGAINVSSIIEGKNEFFIGTWESGLFSINKNLDPKSFFKIPDFPFSKVNDLYIDYDDKLWISSDLGIFLFGEKAFNLVAPGFITNYIHSIRESPEGVVYTTDGSRLFKALNIDGKFVYSSIYSNSEYSFLSLEVSNNLIFAGTSSGDILVFRNEKLDRIITLSQKGSMVFYLKADKNRNLWVNSSSSDGVIRIDTNFKEVRYKVSDFGTDPISSIGVCEKGKVYFGSNLPDKILYFYDEERDLISPVKGIPQLSSGKNFRVNDIAFDENNDLYLATSEGLYIRKNGVYELSIHKSLRSGDIRAIAILNSNLYWVGKAEGLIRNQNGNISIFSELNGLPSKTINSRCLLVDKNNAIWVGTPDGIGLSIVEKTTRDSRLPVFYILDEGTNQKIEILENKVSVLENSLQRLYFKSLSFPGNNIDYQFYITGLDSTWNQPSKLNFIFLWGLKPGDYSINIRARQAGNYIWSSTSVVYITIEKHWYYTWWGISFFLLCLLILLAIIVYFYTRRLMNEKKKLEEIVTIRTSEIIEQKNELEKILAELNASQKTKDKMYSIISHDLKNPFIALLGLTEILLDDYEELSDDEKIDFIRRLYRTSKSTFSLLENLLDWTRSQSGRIVIQPRIYELNPDIEYVIGHVAGIAEQKNIKIINSTPQISAYYDQNTIQTVLRNLIGNAVKFSPENSNIIVNAVPDKEFIYVSVTDSGSGISPDVFDKLFDSEQSISTIGTANEAGTGLGLKLCKEFVEKNGGILTVESSEKGTTFKFSIPLFQHN